MSQFADPKLANRKVLLVDDNRQLLRAIRMRLEMDCFDVATAESGDEAVTLLEGGLFPDIVLTDAVMPGVIQGSDLARYVKHQHPVIPVVLMSGYVGTAVSQVTGSTEIDHFIPKPLKLSDLPLTFERLMGPRVAANHELAG